MKYILIISWSVILATCDIPVCIDPIINEENIRFFLYTPGNQQLPIEFRKDTISANDYNKALPIKVLIHGVNTDSKTTWVLQTKDAYYQMQKTNVVTVDWSKYACLPFGAVTVLPVLQVKEIGNFVGDMIIALGNALQVPISQFHLIGHSLGGQVCGFAGQRIISQSASKVGRITGLDSAGLGYSITEAIPKDRLSSDDATYVDSIHSSDFSVGFPFSIGPIDFLPNGGAIQAGCEIDPCSHYRAAEYFIESITLGQFVAWECDSYLNLDTCIANGNPTNMMGEYTDPSKVGKFYLRTKSAKPYACGTNPC